MTASKAWAGALASVLSVVLTRWIADTAALTPDDVSTLGPMLTSALEMTIGAVVGFAVVWIAPKNAEPQK